MNTAYKSIPQTVPPTFSCAAPFSASAPLRKPTALALAALQCVALLAGVAVLPPAAQAGSTIWANDGTDTGCIMVGEGSTAAWTYQGTTNAKCLTGDKATQTNRVLFYGTNGSAAGSNSLTLGDELYVNGGRLMLNDKSNAANPTNAMSIGNDSTSATGTDAIAVGNGAAVAGNAAVALGKNAQAAYANSVAIGSGSIAGAPNTVSIGAPGAERQMTNVAAGAAPTDAVNVSQLSAVQQVAGKGWNLQADGASGTPVTGNIAPGQTLTVAHGSNTTMAYDAAKQQLTIGMIDNPTFAGTVTANNGLVVNNGTLAVNGGLAVSSGQTVDMGNNVIRHVGAGSADDDAVNVSQLKTVASNVEAGGVRYDVNGGATDYGQVTLAGDPSHDGGRTGGTRITNLAQGAVSADSTDAVNGTQLYDVAGDTSSAYVTRNGQGVRYVRTNAGTLVPTDAYALGTGASALGYNATAAGDNTLALGANSWAGAAGSIALGANSVADRANTVSVGAAGSERQITNVAAGTALTDAVNVSQLQAVADANTLLGQNVTALQYRVSNNTGGGTQTIVTGSDYYRADGANDGTDAASVRNGSKGVAMGANARAEATNSVALGAGSVADRADTVSVGAAGQERQITNVAAGTAATDAVNVSQMNDARTQAVNTANAYTDHRFDSAQRDAYAGSASALAMAGLPQSVFAGKGMVALGGGTYGGESALAVGVSRVTQSGKWVFKGGATTNTRGEVGATVGAGFHW